MLTEPKTEETEETNETEKTVKTDVKKAARSGRPTEWMSDEEFLSTWKAYQQNRHPALWEKLVRENLPLVTYVLHKMPRAQTMDFKDLEAYGILGLIEAIQHYDPGRYSSFVPYAMRRIRGEIFDGILRFMGQQRNYVRKRRGLLACHEKAAQDLMRSPEEKEIRARLNLDRQSYDRLLRQTALLSPVPLDYDEMAYEKALIVEDAVEETVIRRETRRFLSDALSGLKPNEAAVVRLYYFEGLSFREIGKKLGFSGSWASRLHQAAIRRLKAHNEALRGE